MRPWKPPENRLEKVLRDLDAKVEPGYSEMFLQWWCSNVRQREVAGFTVEEIERMKHLCWSAWRRGSGW